MPSSSMPRSFRDQRRIISTEGSKHSFSMPRRLTTQANKVVRGEAWVPEVFPQAEASALPGDVSEVVEIFCQEEAEMPERRDQPYKHIYVLYCGLNTVGD